MIRFVVMMESLIGIHALLNLKVLSIQMVVAIKVIKS